MAGGPVGARPRERRSRYTTLHLGSTWVRPSAAAAPRASRVPKRNQSGWAQGGVGADARLVLGRLLVLVGR